MSSYLVTLAENLTRGLAGLAEERRNRHAQFFRSQQTDEGGYRGREGDADLYYTGFAVRGLAILEAFHERDALEVARFLPRFDPLTLNTIDLLSWLYAALATQAACGVDVTEGLSPGWTNEALKRLETLRRLDGGYAKSGEGSLGSTYHTFLAFLTQEMLGLSEPQSVNHLIQFIYDQQREDGGFVEIAPMQRGGTNPTAAAAALLKRFGAVDEETRDDLLFFFQSVRSGDGGFAANTRIPFADSLSTFTTLLTASEWGLHELDSPEFTRQWVRNELEFPTGGFRGAAWDDQADVEYSFYGLGVLALLGL